ncbi:helix-turn-helix domain-containing protein [Streptomyces mexicanus]
MSVRDDQARRPQGQAPRVVRAEGLDWVKFDRQLARDGSVPTTWKALYAALASFADQDSRETPDGLEDDEDVPTRARLAECIGKSVDTVDRATKGLEGLGLLEVERRQDPDNPKRNIPSLYRLLDHEIWDERAAERAARRKAEREARASARAAKTQAEEQTGGGRTHAARGSRTHAATLAAPMRPGWPHGCGGSSSSLEDLSQTVRDESAQRERGGCTRGVGGCRSGPCRVGSWRWCAASAGLGARGACRAGR